MPGESARWHPLRPRPGHGHSEPLVHLTVELTGGSWAGGGEVCRWVGGWVVVVVVVFVGWFARTDWLTFCDFRLGFRISQLSWVLVLVFAGRLLLPF